MFYLSKLFNKSPFSALSDVLEMTDYNINILYGQYRYSKEMYTYYNWRNFYEPQLITHFAQSYLYLSFKFVYPCKKKNNLKSI